MTLATSPSPPVLCAGIGHPAYTETLPCEAASARRARALVTTALSVWHLEALTDAGALVVTELIANCVRHTDCRAVRVTITRTTPGRVRIAVTDKSTAEPVARTAAGTDEHGRGLAVVAALAEGAGTDTFTWGKRIWADLVATPEAGC